MTTKLYDPIEAANLVDQHEEDIYQDVDANEGTNIGGIVTRTGKGATLVQEIIDIMVSQQLIVTRNDGAQQLYWTSPDWTNMILSNRVAARNWMATNSGENADKMATDLGISIVEANQLAGFLENEGRAKLVFD